MSIRAIVVDDEPLARDELRFMLGQCEDIEVVGEARRVDRGIREVISERLFGSNCSYHQKNQ